MSMRYPSGFISAFYNPLENPNAPTIGTATAGFGSLSITFTAPTNVGGSAITGYVAVAKRTSDGVTFTGSGASSPITVSGLTEAAFTTTVFAVNSYGPSPFSAASNSVTVLPVIGSAYGGGFFAGQIGTSSVASHNLVVSPLSSGQTTGLFKTTSTNDAGAVSDIDGPANSSSMDDVDHPAAQFCESRTIGGFSDWYMPAKNELEVCYFNLKPNTTNNDTNSGTNVNAVPSRGSNYTAGNPAQTSVAAFQTGGAEAFATPSVNAYWSSTQNTVSDAWAQRFTTGAQTGYGKAFNPTTPVRCIRRVAV